MRVADRLGSALRAPFVIDGHQRFVTASVGVTLSGQGDDAEELLRDADAAMYRAKELGKARCELFDQSMRKRAVERLELEEGLRCALENDELRLHYQPAVELQDGRSRRRRGAAPLGAPRARPASARPLHPARRADGADRAHRRVGAIRGVPAARRVGTCRTCGWP